MDEQNYNPTNRAEQEPTQAPEQPVEEPKNGGIGPIVGIVIIIAVLVFGGLYFWGASLGDNDIYDDELPLILGDEDIEVELEDAGLSAEGLSESDDPVDIELDIDATDLDELEAQLESDLGDLEAELDF